MLEIPGDVSGGWLGEPRRALLREQLELKVSPRAGAMYWEALRVLQDSRNEERHAVCCYLLRELQRAFPKDVLVPDLTNAVNAEFVIGWAADQEKAVREKIARSNDKEKPWTKTLRKAVTNFFTTLHERLVTYREFYPKHSDDVRHALIQVDRALEGIAEPDLDLLVREWSALHDYFNRGTHHGPTEQLELEARVRHFERFMGDRLNPPTFSNRQQIAEIVREAEGRAHS